MNYKMVGFVLGRIFLIEAALMLFPMGCAAIYGEWSVVLSFLWPTLIVLVLGLITSLRTPQNTKIYARDGLAIVALVWVLMSAFGALPFVISGEIPSFIDAVFETVSGFTTTGSTILTEATLSFLGLGVKYPFASWGNIINDVNNAYVMTNYLFIWIPAGVCLLLTVPGFNFVGDGLRDAFDPKMKR